MLVAQGVQVSLFRLQRACPPACCRATGDLLALVQSGSLQVSDRSSNHEFRPSAGFLVDPSGSSVSDTGAVEKLLIAKSVARVMSSR